ncbi:MAG: hypothetical protein AAGF73_06885 [Actinomycetota bacterium]
MSGEPPDSVDRTAYAAALRKLKSRSSLNYAAIGSEVERPVSTVHGWITGKHLPYARDNDDFATVLELLGARDIDRWMDILFDLRVV